MEAGLPIKNTGTIKNYGTIWYSTGLYNVKVRYLIETDNLRKVNTEAPIKENYTNNELITTKI